MCYNNETYQDRYVEQNSKSQVPENDKHKFDFPS